MSRRAENGARGASGDETAILTEENDILREAAGALAAENASLKAQLKTLREAQDGLGRDYVALEEQIAGLVGLYAAARRLLESTGRADGLAAVKEVVANLVGSEEVAIFALSADGSTLALVDATGIETARYLQIRTGTGAIGQVAASGRAFVRDTDAGIDAADPIACFPLLADGKVVGTLAVFHLLPQKRRLGAAEQDILELLASQAASALLRPAEGAP